MEELRARFSLEDDVSSELESIADSIDELVENLEEVSSASEGAFDNLENASDVASSVDEIADSAESAGESIDDFSNAASEAGSSTDELASASGSAGDSMSELASSAEEASSAASELSASSQEAGASANDMANSLTEAGSAGASAFETIASAIGAAAIASQIGDIVQQAHELTQAFSEAQKTITNATGASGAALTSMSDSMLEAWAGNDDSLQDVSGAVGEINTRMGYTGDLLTDTTAKFLDYADITGQNVVGSVRNVTQAMNQWGIAQSDVGSVMDKLAYAGQISGASVSELTNTIVRGGAAFQNAGLDIDSAINMLADFELAGIQSSSAIMAMRTAVSKFSKEGVSAKDGIQDAVREIASMGNESQATAKAIEVFGSRAGQQLGLAIRNGTVSVDTFNSSLEQARGTLEVTAEAGESLGEKWEKATNSLQSGIMQGLSPGIEALSEGMASAATSVGDFLRENTGVTQVLAGIATGVGVVTAAITAYVAAMSAAKAVSGLFAEGGLLAGLSLGPLAAVAAGIGLVTAGFLAYADASKRAYEEETQYTAATHQHMETLDGLESKYQAMQEAGQGNTDAARDLNLQIQQEKQWLDSYGMSVDQLIAKNDALLESHESLTEEMSKSKNEVTENAQAHSALIGRLADVSGVSGKAARSSVDMQETYNQLKESLGGLPVSFDGFKASSDSAMKSIAKSAMVKDLTNAIKHNAEANAKYTAENEKLAAASEHMQDEIDAATDRQAEASEAKQKAVQAAINTDQKAQQQNEATKKSLMETNAEYQASTEQLKTYQEQKAAMDEAIEENNRNMENSNQAYQQALEAYKDVDQGMVQQAEACAVASMAYDSVSEKVSNLVQQYDQMTQALMQNYQGQFGAFDKAQVNQEATAAKWIESLQSQAQYWTDYDNNSQVVTDAIQQRTQQTGQDFSNLIDYLNTGTPEAAGLVQDLASKTGEELNTAIDQAEQAVTTIQEKEKGAAENFASVQADLKGKVDEIRTDVESFIQDLQGMSEEAKAAGADIMNGLLDGLTTGSGDSASLSDKISESLNGIFGSGDEAEGGSVSYDVTADTSDADSKVAESKENVGNPPAEMPVTADDSSVAGVADSAKAEIEGTEAEMPVTADDSQVAGVADSAKAQIESTEAEMPVKADTSQVAGDIDGATSGGGREVKITVSADTSQAESSIQSLSTSANGIQPKINVTADISQAQNQLNSIQSLGQSIHPEIKITESGADQVISQINAIGSAGAAVSPIVITVTDNGSAAAIAASINSIPTSKTVTVSVNEVSSKSGHWQGTVSSESSFYAGEAGPELVVRPIAKYANGTTDSDSMFIAGENGPELVTGAPGSTVFPASETNRLIEALSSQQPKPLQIIPNADGGVQSNETSKGGNEKHFVIELKGSGSITTGNSDMDKQQVLDILVENAKPVLMNIIQNEIYEEGDLSYDY